MWRLMLSALLAVGTHSFAPAPLRWGGHHERRFVLAATRPPNGAFLPNKALRIIDQPSMLSSGEIPAFAAKPDNTITLDATNMCIEAHGDTLGDEIRTNQCTGEPNQLWSFLPSGNGQKNQIQLKDTSMCIDVNGKTGGWNGAVVELQECNDKPSETWLFEEPIPPSSEGASASSFVRQMAMPLFSMVAVGALSLGAWLWPRTKCVVNKVPLERNPSGVSLSAPQSARGSPHEMVPAVMAVGSELSDWTDPSCPHRSAKVEELIVRVERFTAVERDYMLMFWSARLNSFQIVPRAMGNRPSLTNSCTVLDLILDNKEHWRDLVSWSGNINTQKPISVAEMVKTFMSVDWTGDALQTPQLVSTMAASQLVNKNDKKYVEAVQSVLEQRSRLSLHREQNHSTFLRYQNAEALLSLLKYDMVPDEVNRGSITHALQRADMVATDELSRQLAFYFSNDSANFDVITLGFSMLTHFVCTSSAFLVTDHDGVVPAPNMELINTALKVVFSEQYPDGSFKNGEPIMSTSDKRDIGNLYVFFFDLIQGLLELPASSLMPYIPNLERCLIYAENNLLKEVLDDGQSVQGWKSNHVKKGGAECWATASVLHFLDRFHRLLRSVMIDDVLREFGGKLRETVMVDAGGRNSWEKLMDADLILGDSTTSLKKVLFDKMLLPQLQQEARLVNVDGNMHSDEMRTGLTDELLQVVDEAKAAGVKIAPSWSVILFGPPGTAKTTIVQNMASTIGWNFVTIDTADFLADGLGNIAGRMTYVFDKLKNLDKTVILFDEIEEFCLDRGNPQCTMESRLLTTAMLTQLNNLRRQQKNIFVVATNRLKAFDAAVIRPGRFDMLLFVGTPSKEARESRLKQKLVFTGIPDSDRQSAMSVMCKIWDEKWDELRFSTFAENERLSTELITLLKAGTFSEEACLNIISQIKRTATIEGDVKEEYIDSEVMSRL